MDICGGPAYFSRKENSVKNIYCPEDLREVLPKRKEDSFKGTYGKVLVTAGSRNMCGAAYLAGKAAYRTGAGLVYIYTEECNRVILQQLLPEAVLITYDPENWEPDTLESCLSDMTALAAGPGMGTGNVKKEILKRILQADHLPRILDADALNILAADESLWDISRTPFIITPHIGEMSRLCGLSGKEIKASPEKTAEGFSMAHQVITVLKDARTVVSDGHICSWNVNGNNGMATGGSGDVLAGIIGGLLAQKMELFEAARLGVYLHALAGDATAEERGTYSMMAGDIADHILYGIS